MEKGEGGSKETAVKDGKENGGVVIQPVTNDPFVAQCFDSDVGLVKKIGKALLQ